MNKNKKRLIKIFKIITIILCLMIFINISDVSTKTKKESAKILRMMSEKEDYDKRELDNNSSSLIVQAKSIEGIEENYNIAFSKKIAEDTYLIDFTDMFEKEQAYNNLQKELEIKNILKNYKLHISDVSNGYEAWGVKSTGMDIYTNKLCLDGNSTEVKIAVLDTGINPNHEVFTNLEARDRLDFTNSYDYVNNDEDVTDDNGHGTVVSGAIAESTPSNVKIVPVKVMDSEGNGSFVEIIRAITDLSTEVDIINLSLGTDTSGIEQEDMVALEEIFENIVNDTGVIIVCAAGNTHKEVEYPASSNYTIAASAIDNNNNFAEFSCYGDKIDFALPGVQVVLPGSGSNNEYVITDGTSISSPFLASSIALVKMENPGYTKNQIIEVLKSNSIDLGAPGKDNYYGYGSIDFKTNMFLNALNLTIENKTKQNATIIFDNKQSNKDFDVTTRINTFLVSCTQPCYVLYTKDNGENYSILEATNYSNYANTYRFNFEKTENAKIIVAIKGDTNFSGTVNNRDITNLMNIYSTSADRDSKLLKILCDVNDSGAINNRDITFLMNVYGGYSSFDW